MLSSRLQQRLQSVRCVHSLRRSLASPPAKGRCASSSAPRPPPPRAAPKPAPSMSGVPPAAARTTTPSAAATRARLNAEREAPPPDETAEEYKERYKSAARRWTATIIALPILLVTSYYLFDRLALGHPPKVLNREGMKRDD